MKIRALIGLAVVAVLVLGAASFALADTSAPYNGVLVGGKLQAQGSVTVTATVNPKITLTITTPDAAQTVNFGTVDPGSGLASKVVTLTVQSNKPYDIGASQSGTIWGAANGMNGLRSMTSTQSAQPKPGNTFSDTISINPDYNASPGAYSGTVVYTAVQN
jgi:hypothetical protein